MEIDTIVLNKNMYIQLKKMLKSSDEDFEIACANLKNIKVSDNIILLLQKQLVFEKRTNLQTKFPLPDNVDHGSLSLSWEAIWKRIKENSPSKLEKELVEFEFTKLMHATLQGLDFNMIKKLKIELKW